MCVCVCVCLGMLYHLGFSSTLLGPSLFVDKCSCFLTIALACASNRYLQDPQINANTHTHTLTHTQSMHLVLLSYVLFWVHLGDFQLMGTANEPICIFSTLLSNGIHVRGDISAKWSADEGCVSEKTRYGCQLETNRAIHMACSVSVARAPRQRGWAVCTGTGFESPPHIFALLNNPWIIHLIHNSFVSNKYFCNLHLQIGEGRAAVPYCI